MNITIDLQGMQTPDARNRGIGRYSSSLLLHFLKVAEPHSITLLYNRNFGVQEWDKMEKEFSNFTNVRLHGWSPLPNTAFVLGDQLARQNSKKLYARVVECLKTDVLLVLAPFTGFSNESVYSTEGDYHSVAIFYDAIPYIFSSQYLTDKNVLKWYTDTVELLKSFQGIAAISESSLKDLVNHLGIYPPHQVVLNCGIDSKFRIDKLKIESKKPYLLSVLGEDPRKNKDGLLRAYKILREDYDLKLDLRIVYKQSEYEKIANVQILSKMGLTGSVQFTDYIDDLELSRMYKECALFVFPSLYEGLGLPLLEAISQGAIAVTGNNSSLNEIITEPELLFDSSDPNDIAKTIDSILKNVSQVSIKKKVKERIDMKYQWHTAAADLMEICESVHSSRSREAKEYQSGAIAWIAPGPGVESGISDYSYEMVEALSTKIRIDWYCEDLDLAKHVGKDLISMGINFLPLSSERLSQSHYDAVIYNFGNSEFHLKELSLFKTIPGIVILHDFYLSGLYWSQYATELDLEGFRQKAKEISGENEKFLSSNYPPHSIIADHTLNEEVVELSTAIIVHSKAAEDMFSKRYHVNTSENQVVFSSLEHLRSLNIEVIERRKSRSKVTLGQLKVGVFGIVSESKFCNEILSAWIEFNSANIGKLYFIGEFHKSFKDKVKELNLSKSVVLVGRVTRSEYLNYLAEVDIAVQLRKIWKGETSGAVLDTLACGIPTITNDIGSFSEIPNSVVIKLDVEPTENEIKNALNELYSNSQRREELSLKAIEYIREYHNPQKSSDKLLDFIRGNHRRHELKSKILSDTTRRPIGNQKITENFELHQLVSLTEQIFVRRTLLIDLDLFRQAGLDRREILTQTESLLKILSREYPISIRFIDSGILTGQIFEVHETNSWSDNLSNFAGVRKIDINYSDLLVTHRLLEVLCKQTIIDKFTVSSGNIARIIDEILLTSKTIN
jgi:glycosyltransferase involved in cell wall biosynthesis